MRRALVAVLVLCSVAFAQKTAPKAPPKATTYDILIRNGHVIDGSGAPWVNADVAIKGDRIVTVGRNLKGTAKRTIDAHGLAVTPGFIDMHTHSDTSLLIDGGAESKIRQGVTTEILGESGSVAPVCRTVRQEAESAPPVASDEPRIKRDWKDLDGYFRRLLKQGSSVNVGSYVAGGTVRTCGMGNDMRDPTPAELEKMKQLVAESMKQGALGYSTGMIYPPNSYAKTPELVEMAKVAAQYGGIYTTHMRDEGAHLLDAINETLTIGEQAHIPVHILHIKATGRDSNEHMKQAIARIAEARAQGIEASADQYPYIASSTGLTTQVPQWAMDGGTPKMLERLRTPDMRAKIREEIVARRGSTPAGYESMIVATVRTGANKQFEGKTMAKIAEMRHQEPADAIMDVLLEEGGRVSMVYFTMKEEDVRLAMQQPWVSVGSDGTAVRPDGPLGRGKPHPRFYGAHARVLGKYVREEHVLPLEEAVRKMTSLAAGQLGIYDRGLLRTGMKADVVVLDPAQIADKATFEDPHQYAVGIDYVLVNGKVVIEGGKHNGARPGQIIYGAGRSVMTPARASKAAGGK